MWFDRKKLGSWKTFWIPTKKWNPSENSTNDFARDKIHFRNKCCILVSAFFVLYFSLWLVKFKVSNVSTFCINWFDMLTPPSLTSCCRNYSLNLHRSKEIDRQRMKWKCAIRYFSLLHRVGFLLARKTYRIY